MQGYPDRYMDFSARISVNRKKKKKKSHKTFLASAPQTCASRTLCAFDQSVAQRSWLQEGESLGSNAATLYPAAPVISIRTFVHENGDDISRTYYYYCGQLPDVSGRVDFSRPRRARVSKTREIGDKNEREGEKGG